MDVLKEYLYYTKCNKNTLTEESRKLLLPIAYPELVFTFRLLKKLLSRDSIHPTRESRDLSSIVCSYFSEHATLKNIVNKMAYACHKHHTQCSHRKYHEINDNVNRTTFVRTVLF